MLSNLSDLLMSRVDPDPVQAPSQSSMVGMSPQSQAQAMQQPVAAAPAQAQYLQSAPAGQSGKVGKTVQQPVVSPTNTQDKAKYLNSASDGKPQKTPQAVLDWLDQMEHHTGAFAEQRTEETKYVSPKSKHLINNPGPVWTEYQYKTGKSGAPRTALILEGMRLPDGSIDRSHPDVGKVDYQGGYNPSGGDPMTSGVSNSRALKNEKGNWSFRNPVNPNKTHEYTRTGASPEEVQYETDVYKDPGWNIAGVDEFSMTPEQRGAIQAKIDANAREFAKAQAEKAKNSKPVKK